jgi:hypothetical protein
MTQQQIKFSVGDIVTCTDKTNILYRRDNVVVSSDISTFGVISEGLTEVYFCSNDENFAITMKGQGRLTPEQEELLKDIMQKWPLPGILKDFPDIIQKEKEAMHIKGDKMVMMTVSASVPYQLAQYWRKFQATLDLSKGIYPELNTDTHRLMMEWMLIAMIKAVPTITLTKFLEGHQQQ